MEAIKAAAQQFEAAQLPAIEALRTAAQQFGVEVASSPALKAIKAATFQFEAAQLPAIEAIKSAAMQFETNMPKINTDMGSKHAGLNADILKTLEAAIPKIADMVPKFDVSSMIGASPVLAGLAQKPSTSIAEMIKSVTTFDQAERSLVKTDVERSFQRQLQPVDMPRLPVESDRGATAIAELHGTMSTVVTFLTEIKEELRLLRTSVCPSTSTS